MAKKNRKGSNIVTIQTDDGIVCLSGYASAAAHDYLDLILEACQRRKVDARDAIINTDSYPQLNKTADVEFAIGWLHGVAEALDLDAEDIFDAMVLPAAADEIEQLKRSWALGDARRRRMMKKRSLPPQKVTPRRRAA